MDRINSALYIQEDKLPGYAAANARLLPPQGQCRAALCAAGLSASYRELRRFHDFLQRRYTGAVQIPSACEWILDNWYMIEREYRSAIGQLRRGGKLRRSGTESMLSQLCSMLVVSGMGRVTGERFTLYMKGFQTVTVLSRAELRLLMPSLSAAVIESLAQLCRQMKSAADTDVFVPALEALFSTLRLFAALDTEELLRAADKTDEIMCADPSGVYPKMDSGTRLAYLERIEKLAQRQGVEEYIFARGLIKRAEKEKKHPGFYLFPEKGALGGKLYIGANVLLTLFFTLLGAFRFHSAAAGLLLWLPVWELTKAALDLVLSRLIKPGRLFRMDAEKGLGSEGRCICVISALLGEGDGCARLEELYHACKNDGSRMYFGLLADLPGSDRETEEGDSELISPLRQAVAELNKRYGAYFYLFTRKRSFDGERYTAKERKRGALMELAKLLCDEPSELEVTGEKDALGGVRLILTLDSDTGIYPGSAGQLISAMLHPLNRPVVDKKAGIVRSGHAIIQPRLNVELESASATDFSLIFSGGGGSDPYGGVGGELYMDAFDCGGFAGKGLIDAGALLECTRHFPEGRILSHDAPEGAFLRGAYMGDAEFSDRFPGSVSAYFKRQHRWIRGDWQNLRFLSDRRLRPIDRWRLFDSLRRSITPAAALAAILTGLLFPGSGAARAAWTALAAVCIRIPLALTELALKSRESVGIRRRTKVIAGVGGAIVQSFIRLWLLPFEAWVSVSAILTALWRMLVSGKKLLQWQTAAQSEGGRSLGGHMKLMWFSMALGLMLLIFCPAVAGRAAGLMWLISPGAAAALALPAASERSLSAADRDYLFAAARECYSYFEHFCTAEDHFLPPDNFQEQPPVGLARRSSPTNMGLALCAHLSAFELGFISRAKLTERTGELLATFEKMEVCMGHFYNWYDTATLRPLRPAYISTVDSGNFYAALAVAEQAMGALGQEKERARLRALMERMDFAPLYDPVRGLFHICWDSAKKQGAGGWYDLMASEAMLTSYIAAAKGDVPVKHWRRLSRAQLQKDGYRGLASWTGTMFEYLMPELFLPLYRGGLLYESVRFCLYAQKKRVWAGKPWGISESAFYSLDSAMNYRYKANGCAALALKRGQDEDMVVSPYSSFLALAADAAGSMKNLRRLESMGARGRFGFIEALDFTPERCRSETGEQVRCYMAHHIGMSLAAAANALKDNCIQRRFMARPEMRAFSLLLQERLDEGAVLIRRRSDSSNERTERPLPLRWKLRGGSEDTAGHVTLLSNGSYSLVCDDSGSSRAVCGPVTIYEEGRSTLCRAGMGLELCCGGERMELLPCREAQLWELSEESARFELGVKDMDCSLEFFTACGESGERRSVMLRPHRDCRATLTMKFTPILALREDYISHSAFWSLGLEAYEDEGILLLRRLPRGGCGELWLGLGCSEKAAFSADLKGGLGALSKPFVRISAELSLLCGERREISFALALAMDRQGARDGAKRILTAPAADKGSMLSAAALHLNMTAEEVGAAMELLAPVLRNGLREAAPRRDLWPYAISGELPIVCCDGQAAEWEAVLRRFCLIKSCGINAELVYFTNEQGEYRQPVFRKVSEKLERMGLGSLCSCPGGVHFVPYEARETIMSRAAWAPKLKREPLPPPPDCERSLPRVPGCVPEHRFDKGSFDFYVRDSLPGRPWQHILTNGRFGFIALDCGMGSMWQENAREMPITLPPRDVFSTELSESLWIERGGERISLFAANDAFPCRVSFSPGLARWEKETEDRCIRISAFVPTSADARVMIIEGARGAKLGWTLRGVLGSRDGSSLVITAEKNALRAENPESYLPGTVFRAICSGTAESRCRYSPAAMHFSLISDDVTVIVCGCGGEEELRSLATVDAAFEAMEQTKTYWLELVNRLELRTEDKALLDYVNRWCAYQGLACRLMGRSSLYQAGGAIGFRDQLQDAVNLMLLSRDFARERILDACRHQYEEGDVMHWWHPHPEGDKGVRSRCSDDLLWLVWAVCEYCEKSGDTELCRTELPYISSAPLESDERDRYETPELSGKSGSVIDHARAALDCAIGRGFGRRGLPLMGSGDWNDGLDRVEGESVWLGFFMAHCARRFAALLEKLGLEGADKYRSRATKLKKAAENTWQGDHYARAYFPDGSPLGAERIDSLPQSWAVLSGSEANAPKAREAVETALHRLVDRETGLVKLFDPPFSADERPCPGYIASYGEGFRENGGQYTHAAIWLAMACFKLGKLQEGWEVLKMLLPQSHDARRYGAEPYVIAADVYSAAGREGEAGWSWYTGSAGWYFRAVYEELLGLKLREGRLYIEPGLSEGFGPCRVFWTDGSGARREIDISGDGIRVDGKPYRGEGLQ